MLYIRAEVSRVHHGLTRKKSGTFSCAQEEMTGSEYLFTLPKNEPALNMNTPHNDRCQRRFDGVTENLPYTEQLSSSTSTQSWRELHRQTPWIYGQTGTIPTNLLPTTHKPQSQNSKNMDGIKFLEFQSCFLAPFRGDFSDAKKMRKRGRDDERVGGVDGTLLK